MDAESRWLLRGIGYALLVDCLVLGVLAIVFGWPADKVGNGFQLLGLMFAALGIPVVSPWLASVERRTATARDATGRWLVARRRELQHLSARILRRPENVTVHAGMGSARASGGGASVVIGRQDPETADVRALLVRHDREILQLTGRVDALENGRIADRRETQQRISALRTELQEHVLSITREGWHYIVGGAGITALGIIVALFG